MSKRTNNKPPRRNTGAGTEYKDLPRFNALVNKVKTDNENKRRTGVDK